MSKLSRNLQILLGILSGAGIWLSLYAAADYSENHSQENFLISYLFLIIFVVIMFLQRYLERKFETRFRLFTKVFLIALCVGAGIFCLYVFVFKGIK